MGGFPALPSAYNPYVSAAGEAAGHAASIFHSARIAAAEADRQKRIQQQQQAAAQAAQQQRDISNRFRLSELGAIPAEVEGRDSSGLITHSPNPAIPQEGGGTFLDVPLGNRNERYYIPTAAQKQRSKLDDSNSVVAPPGSELEKQLQEELGIKPGTRISDALLAQAREYHDARQRAKGTWQLNTSGDFLSNGVPVPTRFNPRTGQLEQVDLSGVTGAAPQTGAVPGASPGGPFDMRNWRDYTGADNWQGGPETGNLPPLQTQPAQTGAAPAKTGGLTFRKKPAAERKEGPEDWERIITDEDSDPKEVARATRALKLHREPEEERAKASKQAHEDTLAERAERKQERQDAAAEKQAKAFNDIEDKKGKQNRDATTAYVKAHREAVTPEEEQDALDQYRAEVGANEDQYRSAIERETGNKLTPNNWWQGIQGSPSKFGTGGKNNDPAGVRTKKRDPLGVRPGMVR